MIITSEKATQKSITCSGLSVHQERFLWASLAYKKRVLSTRVRKAKCKAGSRSHRMRRCR
jgi:hypothetical protein